MKVDAYYIPDEEGKYNEVFIYQNDMLVDKLENLGTFNTADAEQTEEDKAIFLKQQKKIASFRKYLDDNSIADVGVIRDKETYIEDEAQVKSYLEQYGITAKDLDSYYDEIVNQKVLKDWCTIYDSKYSPSNYGDVKVETQWENWW